ncbi:hypothetical protein PCK1_002220 [Pneumocystis canis]|nr:hypothetical protein PCK1_002220 [Pneumocystis canis]
MRAPVCTLLSIALVRNRLHRPCDQGLDAIFNVIESADLDIQQQAISREAAGPASAHDLQDSRTVIYGYPICLTQQPVLYQPTYSPLQSVEAVRGGLYDEAISSELKRRPSWLLTTTERKLWKHKVYVRLMKDPYTSEDVKFDDEDGHYIVILNTDLTPRYKIIKLLGQGTFGKVIQCYDRLKKDYCAIKIIRAIQKYRDASMIELRVLRTLSENDPNNIKFKCIHMRDCFDYRNHICIVMDLLGMSVFDFLKNDSIHTSDPMFSIKENRIVNERNFSKISYNDEDLFSKPIYVENTQSFRRWMILYPIYFDAKRSIKGGRKVLVNMAVMNPLAKTIANGAKALGFSCIFEPNKTHPKDWANPGRIRIFFKDNGIPVHSSLKTSIFPLTSIIFRAELLSIQFSVSDLYVLYFFEYSENR